MKLFLFTVFLLKLTLLTAQVTLSGKLTDFKSNPLQGASVSIKNSYDGTTTDSLGNFSFTSNEKGNQTLEVTLSGYSSYSKNISLDEKGQVINITIKELITELKAVILSAGSFEASDQKRTTVLNSIDIVTTASANADITAAIKTLPGAQQVGEEEGLFVRGGTANETKAFIDGTLVNNFYYSPQPGLAQRGRFNPFLFKGTVFSAGGYSALYGQALSSALILESIDLPEKSSAQLSFSLLSLGGGVQKLSKNKKYSWGVSYNYTDLRLAYVLIKQKADYFRIPALHNADANFRIRTKAGIIKYYGILGTTDVGFRYGDIDSTLLKDAFALKNVNMYHNIYWREKIGSIKMTTGFSLSTNKDDIQGETVDENNQKQLIPSSALLANKNFGLVATGRYVNGKLVFEKKLNGLNAIRAGGEYNYSNDHSVFTTYNGFKGRDTIKENLFSAFAEGDIYITNNIAAKLGTRAEHSSLLGKWNIAPRISLAYKLKNNSQLSFAYGIFYQNPERKYLPSSGVLNFSKATHYILQYQKLSNSRTFRTEIFYKNYDELYKTSVGYGRTTIANNNGFGYAKGLELFWRDKKTIKNLDYWVSYSYLDTKRDFLNYPGSINPSFSATHTASLVVKKFITKLKSMFNASYSFASGRPYYNIRYDNATNSNKIYDHGKTKDFNSLSVSINYLPNIAKTGSNKFTVFVFSITNVLGSNNVYGYNYSNNGNNKQPILPPAKRFFFLGCFLSFGIDRTNDAINNNL